MWKLNQRHLDARFPGDAELAARIASYKLAAKMQLSVPAVSDLSTEPAHVLAKYGADDPKVVANVRKYYAGDYALIEKFFPGGKFDPE